MPARKTVGDYRELAESRGFAWLGPEPTNSKAKTEWQCSKGHRWKTNFNIIQQGFGCPYCSGKAQKSNEDYHNLAREKGFIWLGPEVSSVGTKTGWHLGRIRVV